jgi:Secretion system C-terminal sorting domain
MKKILTALFTSLMLFSFSAMFAQNICGTSSQTQYDGRERLFQNRIDAANQQTANQRDVTVYVPIKFHIVTKTDGSGGVSETQLLSLLCQINNKFADQDMVYYINYPFSYVNNTVLYNDPGSTAGLNTIAWNWSTNSVNIFITNSAGGANVLGYYLGAFQGYPYEHIVIRKNSIGAFVASHELGHFFSLEHPFYGWENNPWDPDVHGMQVGTWAPNGPPYVLNEKMDGSNCLSAGDGLCDTPPDYLFAFSSGQSGCSWNGGAMDPNGVVVEPMENNMMSYFTGCSEYVFTPDQKEAIRNDFNSPSRAYINHTYVPPTDDITVAPEPLEPIDDEITAGFSSVYFEWEPSPNTQRYLLEIDRQPTFAFLPKRYIIANGSSVEIEDIFNVNTTYYWRVTPYNDGNTCNLPTSATESFKTGAPVSTKNIEAVNDWSVIPNPVRQNEKLNIRVEVREAFDADIRLFSVTGQLIKSVSKHRFTIGANNYDLDISGINTGMYIVVIQSEKGVINKKIVISE